MTKFYDSVIMQNFLLLIFFLFREMNMHFAYLLNIGKKIQIIIY